MPQVMTEPSAVCNLLLQLPSRLLHQNASPSLPAEQGSILLVHRGAETLAACQPLLLQLPSQAFSQLISATVTLWVR